MESTNFPLFKSPQEGKLTGWAKTTEKGPQLHGTLVKGKHLGEVQKQASETQLMALPKLNWVQRFFYTIVKGEGEKATSYYRVTKWDFKTLQREKAFATDLETPNNQNYSDLSDVNKIKSDLNDLANRIREGEKSALGAAKIPSNQVSEDYNNLKSSIHLANFEKKKLDLLKKKLALLEKEIMTQNPSIDKLKKIVGEMKSVLAPPEVSSQSHVEKMKQLFENNVI